GPAARLPHARLADSSPTRVARRARRDSPAPCQGLKVRPLIFGDGLTGRLLHGAEELLAVLPDPVDAGVAMIVHAATGGDHVLGKEFIRTPGRLPVRAVVSEEQKSAEATGLFGQPLDGRDGVVRCADGGDPEVRQ